MSEQSCLNCNKPASGTYDLLVRGNDHSEVPLCDECHEAIQREIAELDESE